MKQVYAYVRVSTASQNTDRQVTAMTAQGVPVENIFIDHQSGKDFNRKAYKKLLKRLKSGDLLIIHELERIGRNYDEILENWRLITKKKMADIRVLDMPILDTTVHKDLLGTLISDIVFRVSEEEREMIERRMAQSGMENMRAYLVKMAIDGRVIRVELESVREMVRLLSNATNNINQIAHRVNSGGNFYAADLEELSNRYEEIWGQTKTILRKLSAL